MLEVRPVSRLSRFTRALTFIRARKHRYARNRFIYASIIIKLASYAFIISAKFVSSTVE